MLREICLVCGVIFNTFERNKSACGLQNWIYIWIYMGCFFIRYRTSFRSERLLIRRFGFQIPIGVLLQATREKQVTTPLNDVSKKILL